MFMAAAHAASKDVQVVKNSATATHQPCMHGRADPPPTPLKDMLSSINVSSTSAMSVTVMTHQPATPSVIQTSALRHSNIHQQQPRMQQQQPILLLHPDHTRTQQGPGAAPATAAAALPAAISAPGMPAAVAAATVPTAAFEGSGLPRALSPLDAALAKQRYALEPLLPTPTNINPVHLPRSDLLHFVALQSWVSTNLNMQLPLLNGMFVLVPASPQQPMSNVLQAACGYSPSDSSTFAAAAYAAIPWRLRQVSAVEVVPGVDPADAAVVLVGGDRVRAGAVREGLLAEVQDHEYLCCEVADLQRRRQLRQLCVCDVAHMAWRLRVACDLEETVKAFEQALFELAAPSCDPATFSQARLTGLESARSVLMQLPPDDWVAEQVLQYVELNPSVWPESSDQPWQLLSTEQYGQLLQDAAAAWQHYVQQRMAGQPPQPVTDRVPWLPIVTEAGNLQEPPADAPHQLIAQPVGVGGGWGMPAAAEAGNLQGPHADKPQQPIAQPVGVGAGWGMPAAAEAGNLQGPHPPADEPQQPAVISPVPHALATTSSPRTENDRANTDQQDRRASLHSLRGGQLKEEPCSTSNTGAQHSPVISQQPASACPSNRPEHSSRRPSSGQRDPSRSSCGGNRSHSRGRSASRRCRSSLSANPERSRSCSASHGRDRSMSRGRSSSLSASPERSCSCSRSTSYSGCRSHSMSGCTSTSGDTGEASPPHRPLRRYARNRSRSRSPGRDRLYPARAVSSRQHCSRSRSLGRDRPYPARAVRSSQHRSSHRSRSRSLNRDHPHPAKRVDTRQHRSSHRSRSRSLNRDHSYPAQLELGASSRQHRSSHRSRSRSPSSEEPRPRDPQQLRVSGDSVSNVGRTAWSDKYSMVRRSTPQHACTAQRAHFSDPSDPSSRNIERHTQQYLQQLAVKLTEVSGPPPKPGQPSDSKSFHFGWLRDRVPVPPLLVSHYGSVSKFFKMREELHFIHPTSETGLPTFRLRPEYHARLLAAAKQGAQQRQKQDREADSSGWPHQLESAAADGTAAAAMAAAGAAGVQTWGSNRTANMPDAVETQIQLWLRRLALLLGPVPGSGEEAASIPLQTLTSKLPVPPAVLQWYRSVERFVNTRQELCWATGKEGPALRLERSYHRQLLEDAARAGLTAVVDGTRVSRANACLIPGLQLAHADRITQATQVWLQKLAVQLQPVRHAPHPPTCINMYELKQVLPLPNLLWQHYRGMVKFVAANPELQWTEPPRINQTWYLYIVPECHERLLKAAEKAGGGAARRG